MSHRYDISEANFKQIEHLLPGKPGDGGRVAADNRLFINAIMWIAKTGAAWRDLPVRFGKWNTVARRFRRWAKKGVYQQIFEVLQDPDLEWVFMDSTIVKAHQHAAGAKDSNATDEALGRSRGGFTTKIHVIVDALGNPIKIILSPGQDGDITYAEELLEGVDAEYVGADKAYDSDTLRKLIEEMGAEAVIPCKKNRKENIDHDKEIYKSRNLVERLFNQLKQMRRIATRYEKTASSFLGLVHFAAAMILLK